MKPISINIITVLLLLFSATTVFAQTYYYNHTKTFNEDGYTYQCDVPEWKMVTLYNKENQFTYVDMVNKTTGKVYSPIINHDPSTFQSHKQVREKFYSIVNGSFSAAEKQRLKGDEFSITMCFNPETGRVMEVRFKFTTNNAFATIPLSVYRNIELQLKEHIWVTPTAEAVKYNYLFLNLRQGVE